MLLSERVSVWKTAYNTANLPVGMTTPPDSISKWLVITRAAVFSMTVTSGLIGGLLAVGAERLAQIGGTAVGSGFSVNYGFLALAVIGLVVAHAANNMINDYFDLEGGIDTDDYVRAQYAPHPILSGWVTKRQLGAAILIANLVDLAILVFLASARGPLVVALPGLTEGRYNRQLPQAPGCLRCVQSVEEVEAILAYGLGSLLSLPGAAVKAALVLPVALLLAMAAGVLQIGRASCRERV